MSFRTLIPGGAATRGAEFGFSIASRGSSGRKDLRITISPDLMSQAKWTDKTHLKLDIDDDEKKGQLSVVTEGSFQARKISTTPATGRGFFYFPYSGEVTKLFQEYDGIYELDNWEVTLGAITFDLPPAAEEEEEE